MVLLVLLAVLPAGASIYFFAFWRWFEFWRRHGVAALAMMVSTLAAVAAGVWLARDTVLAPRVDVPLAIRVAGWVLVATSWIFSIVADRQLGFHVRTFMPFFEPRGRIELRTTGAYAIVRHPLYASGIAFQLGAFVATGQLAILAACIVFAAGAAWFVRQEERRLAALLDDPAAYDRYRARVPALVPRLRRRRP